MKKRPPTPHASLSPEMKEAMAIEIARRLERLMGWPVGRLTVAITAAPPGYPFKTGVGFTGNPELTPAESEQLVQEMRIINTRFGGSPMMTDEDLPPSIRARQRLD